MVALSVHLKPKYSNCMLFQGTRYCLLALSRKGYSGKHVASHQSGDIEPMLVLSWPTVCDAGPTINQHCVNVLCLKYIVCYEYKWYHYVVLMSAAVVHDVPAFSQHWVDIMFPTRGEWKGMWPVVMATRSLFRQAADICNHGNMNCKPWRLCSYWYIR